MTMLVQLVASAFRVYELLLLARILLSWFPNLDWRHPAARFIHDITEPVLGPARRIIPPLGMIDISPIVVFFVLDLVRQLVLGLLSRLA